MWEGALYPPILRWTFIVYSFLGLDGSCFIDDCFSPKLWRITQMDVFRWTDVTLHNQSSKQEKACLFVSHISHTKAIQSAKHKK